MLKLHYCSKFSACEVLACFGSLPKAQADILGVIMITNSVCAFFVFWENKVIYLLLFIYLFKSKISLGKDLRHINS